MPSTSFLAVTADDEECRLRSWTSVDQRMVRVFFVVGRSIRRLIRRPAPVLVTANVQLCEGSA